MKLIHSAEITKQSIDGRKNNTPTLPFNFSQLIIKLKHHNNTKGKDK